MTPVVLAVPVGESDPVCTLAFVNCDATVTWERHGEPALHPLAVTPSKSPLDPPVTGVEPGSIGAGGIAAIESVTNASEAQYDVDAPGGEVRHCVPCPKAGDEANSTRMKRRTVLTA